MNRMTEEVRPDEDDDPEDPETRENNPVYTFQFDTAGNLTERVDPLLHSVAYTFDALNRMLTTTNGEGEVTALGYDDAGNLTSMTNGEDETTSNTFDAANQQTAVTNALEKHLDDGLRWTGPRGLHGRSCRHDHVECVLGQHAIAVDRIPHDRHQRRLFL